MPWKPIVLGGLAAVIVLAGVVAVLPFATGDDGTRLPLGQPTPDGPAGAPGELPDLDPEGPADVQPPPEAQAFIDRFDVAGSVLHLAIAEERHGEQAGPEGRLDILGDVWVELDDGGAPLRFVGRYYNGEGELVQALYQDRQREMIAAIEQARVLGEEAPPCIQEGAGEPQLLASSVPFLVERELLEMQGYEASEELPPGGAPETAVDDRVGEPERVVTMPEWSAAAVFEQFDQELVAYHFVLLDPDSGLLLGQATLMEVEEGERELIHMQGVGDIHVHPAGEHVDAVFDLQDAVSICEEIEAA